MIRSWHRWLGLVVVAPLLFVSVTGVLLNHADELSLNERQVSSGWLLSRYGMGLTGEPASFAVGQRIVSDWAGNTFLDGRALGLNGGVIGAIATAQGFAIVCPDVIHLTDENGDLIEDLTQTALPEGRITAVAAGGVVRVENGTLWQFGADYLDFSPIADDTKDLQWSTGTATSDRVRRMIETSYRGGGVPWSRLLLDLHSGRFFGVVGRWVVDGCVVLLIVLSWTGVRLSLKNRRGRMSEMKKDDES